MIVGFFLYHGIDALERFLFPWRNDSGRTQIRM